jgi:mannose-6-phosphate isomerase-like protein (cupin superfamily)
VIVVISNDRPLTIPDWHSAARLWHRWGARLWTRRGPEPARAVSIAGVTQHAYRLQELRERLHATGDLYLEFLRFDSMSVGLYALEAGADDPQTPHTEDEAYHVLSGRASIWIAGSVLAVEPGSVVFVGKNVEHRFVDVSEDLEVLVFFAPAERT